MVLLVSLWLGDLSSLEGCWQWRNGTLTGTECWVAMNDYSMMGFSYTTKDGQRREHEFLMIERQEGPPIYVAMPSNQERTEFRLTSQDHDTFVFENPDHDFPKRIVYRFLSNDELEVRVEGDPGSRVLTFSMNRISCIRSCH
ncbi:MAG: hypothetical protein KDC35_13685 [Acidobacteria bacterium]|nr:hypothetical protein [Acidobacteriota bacterium]